MVVIAERYARALFELADEGQQLDAVAEQIEGIATMWMQHPELQDAFDNPTLEAEQRVQMVSDLCERSQCSKLIKNTLSLLAERGRLSLLPKVAAAFRNQLGRSQGRVNAEITAASHLPEAYFEQLKSTLENVTGKKIALRVNYDTSLIAGVITRVGDQVYDGSVRSRLDEIEEHLLQNQR